VAVIRRHWTIHALWQFREGYNSDDDDPLSLINLVDRIEFKDRAACVSLYWEPTLGAQ